MTDKYRSCTTCHTDTSLQYLDSASGEEKALAVTIRRMPILSCGNQHRQFVRPDFALEMLNHLVEEDEAQLPAGDEKGLLFKHFHCTDCGQELQPKPDHRHTFTVELALPEVAPFQLDLTMPVYRCGGCGKEQLHSAKEIRKLTPSALVHAFKSAGLASG